MVPPSWVARLLAPVDRLFQGVFDAIFVFLMRQGVPRWRIRYALWTAFSLAYACSLWTWFTDWMMAPIAVALVALHFWFYGRTVDAYKEADLAAERGGAASWADSDWCRASAKFMGVLFMALSSATPLSWLVADRLPSTWPNDAARFTCGWFALAAGYLCRTPPTRPKPREARSLALSPQPG